MFTLDTLKPSIIRTLVPLAVGAIVAGLAYIGLPIDKAGQDGLAAFLAQVIGWLVSALYYIVVRWLEQNRPKFGWLLGLAKSPDSYSNDQTIPGEVVADHGIITDYPEVGAEVVTVETPGPDHAA
jgi:hypothetical protein